MIDRHGRKWYLIDGRFFFFDDIRKGSATITVNGEVVADLWESNRGAYLRAFGFNALAELDDIITLNRVRARYAQ